MTRTMLLSNRYRSPVHIPVDSTTLEGDLTVPRRARGLVIFAHGSGSSRLSPRNQRVAHWLSSAGMATLLTDLLDAHEADVDAVTGEHRFDIELLAARVAAIVGWAAANDRLAPLAIGLFGASTGAAAALVAAAREPQAIAAVVSRGGRPDLAGGSLTKVMAPTLLIVGGADEQVLQLNEAARSRMRCECELVIVPGAGHLFDRPEELDEVSRLAATWFRRHLLDGSDMAVPRNRGYEDRHHAADVLAAALAPRIPKLVSPVVVGIPRGGVVIAARVAAKLGLPLGLAGVHKIGAPGEPELALGAVDEDGMVVIDRRASWLGEQAIRELGAQQAAAVHAHAGALRSGRLPEPIEGRDVLLVDDGYATGMTATAAARMLHRHGARRVVLAVPVAPAEAVAAPPPGIDEVVCPYSPSPFLAVGIHYRDFPQVEDEEARSLLTPARAPASLTPP